MAENTLVEGLWTDASNLVRQLDLGEYSPTIAVWYFYEDVHQWRLLLGGPAFDDLLPKKEDVAYQKVAEAISTIDPSGLSISMVKLLRRDAPIAGAIKFLMNTGTKGITQASFSNTTINGIFLKDMVIIRSE